MEGIPKNPSRHFDGSSESDSRIKQELDELNSLSLHTDNLYDQDEDMAGNRVDEGTGLPIDNSTSVDNLDDFGDEIIDPTLHANEKRHDILPPLPEEEDAAAKWLREFGREDEMA